jgi:ATP-dependent Lon protease
MNNDNMKDAFLDFTSILDNHSEFIPLVTNDDETEMDNMEAPELLPILPLRNNVLFPGVVIPITVGRDKSIRLINHASKAKRAIGVVSQKDQNEESPEFADLNKVGTLAEILRVLKMPDGSTTVIIQGKKRFEWLEAAQSEPFLEAKVVMLPEIKPAENDIEFEAIFETVKDLALRIIRDSPNIPSEAAFAIKNIESPTFLINFICSNVNADVRKKQEMLEVSELKQRAQKVLEHLTFEVKMLDMRNEITQKARVDIDKQQREFFLHQQMRTIQEELGQSPQEQDINELKQRAKKKRWSEKVEKVFNKELDKLQRMNPQAAEYSVQLNYLDTLLDVPWNEFSKDVLDVKRAEEILDRDHFGLKKVKERILEYLAVLKLKGDMKSPILCFYGPPGVGKTSLGKSIAEALGRKYVRMSLGGLHDESEIRGHRKTYIGAMPGRIVQNLKKAETLNPVFILDEVDKLGRSMHGDPSSALLEVLDPEQNSAFYDNYLETEIDLSHVMFIATANNVADIQGPLRDRMEMIEVNGYTVEEKIEIGLRHLVPKQIKAHGLRKSNFKISPELMEKVIIEYTRESGVRGLEKMIAKLVRNRAKHIAMGEPLRGSVNAAEIEKVLGVGISYDRYFNNDVAGVVTGLAWTAVGGDVMYIESSITPGKGKLTLTGNLGEVMKESAVIALEFLKAHAHWFDLDPTMFERYNVHIHVPEGATPKDGPSAGIAMLTSLASLFTQKRVKKALAMTGEITLRGDVLPVGGIKEKVLAAKRSGIKEVILCERNRKDVEDINQDYLQGLTFHYVKTMREVLSIAITDEDVVDKIVLK